MLATVPNCHGPTHQHGTTLICANYHGVHNYHEQSYEILSICFMCMCVSVCVRVHACQRETCSSQNQLGIGHHSRVPIYQDANENLIPITSWEQCQSCLACVQNVYTGICHFPVLQQLSKPAKQNNRILPMRFIHRMICTLVQPEEPKNYNCQGFRESYRSKIISQVFSSIINIITSPPRQ